MSCCSPQESKRVYLLFGAVILGSLVLGAILRGIEIATGKHFINFQQQYEKNNSHY